MDRQRVVELFSGIKTWRRRGERAPHKPLLLLLALARVGRPDGRWLAFREVDRPMRRLLAEFGPNRDSYHSEYPYDRLRNDGLWEFDAEYELQVRDKKSDLVAQDVSAGFPDPIYEQLRSDRGLVRDVALRLLHGHFPETMHEDILQAVGTGASIRRRRAPAAHRATHASASRSSAPTSGPARCADST